MPTLGNALDFAKYEGRNLRAHQLGSSPATPVTGQLYYNTADNTLYWWDGSQWVSARGGAAATPPATTGSLGTIQLAGDLAGTATSPQIAASVITDVEVAAANKDGVAGTASMRTLGSGAQQAAAGNDSRFTNARAPTNHAMTHEPGGSDAMSVDATPTFASLRSLGPGAQQAMPGNRTLDAISTPVANVSMANFRVLNVAAPVLPNDAANRDYVDQVAQGLDAKRSCRLATTANVNLSVGSLLNIDGVVTLSGDRILVKNQTNPAENGIYQADNAAWVRTFDADTWAELPSAYVWVEVGATQADTGWVSTVDQGGTLGTTAVTWTQFSGAGQITAGAGMTKTGNALDVGAGAGITVNADTIQVANDGITNAMLADGAVNLASADVTGTLPIVKGGTGQTSASSARIGLGAAGYYSSATHAAGATISIPQATHLCRISKGLIVQVQDEASGAIEITDIVVAANGDVTVTYGASVAANSKRVTVIG